MTHTGSCHCGAVKISVRGPLTRGTRCNCSICSRAGWTLAFVGADAFELVSGATEMTDYQFGKRHIHHPFCKVCGARPFSYGDDADGNRMYSINTNCLEGFDAGSLEISDYDGASR